MNGLRISKILLTLMFLTFMGCATVEERPPTEGLTKIKIQQAWGRKPDKIYYNSGKLKYGADELWEYEYRGGGSIDRFYFKENVLIREEHVTYGDF